MEAQARTVAESFPFAEFLTGWILGPPTLSGDIGVYGATREEWGGTLGPTQGTADSGKGRNRLTFVPGFIYIGRIACPEQTPDQGSHEEMNDMK